MHSVDFYLSSKAVERDFNIFKDLPPQAQKLIFAFLKSHNVDFEMLAMIIANPPWAFADECQSPIEKILIVAFELCQLERNHNGNLKLTYSMLSQYEIHANGKTYYADFVIDPSSEEDDDGRRFKRFPLVIECDGHEFHEKTKEQVIHDNERDFNIKSAGYDILHFSGSQIYNEPWKCANQILDYIIQHTEVIQQNG